MTDQQPGAAQRPRRRQVLSLAAAGLGSVTCIGEATASETDTPAGLFDGAADTIAPSRDSDESHELAWERTYARGNETFFGGCCSTNDGGIVLGGAFTVDGQPRAWAVGIDTDGSEIWREAYEERDIVVSVVPARDGGALLVSAHQGDQTTGGFPTSIQYNWDASITKIDRYGERQWRRTFGGADADRAYRAIRFQDSSYLFCGYTHSYTDSTGHDMWAVKVDDSGFQQWSRTYGSDPSFYANGVTAAPDGGALLVGGRWYDDTSYRNQLILKIDGSGTEEWRQIFGSSGREDNSYDAVTTNAGYAVACSNGDTGLVRGLDGDGAERWQVQLGSSVQPNTIERTANGEFLLTGGTGSSLAGDLWLGKVSAVDGLVWDRTVPTATAGYGITRREWGAIVAGETSSEGWATAVTNPGSSIGSRDGSGSQSSETSDGSGTESGSGSETKSSGGGTNGDGSSGDEQSTTSGSGTGSDGTGNPSDGTGGTRSGVSTGQKGTRAGSRTAAQNRTATRRPGRQSMAEQSGNNDGSGDEAESDSTSDGTLPLFERFDDSQFPAAFVGGGLVGGIGIGAYRWLTAGEETDNENGE